MSEWQPARFVKHHPVDFTDKTNEALCKGGRIHVREADPRDFGDLDWFRRETGCDATRFFWVRGCYRGYLCEHEILTD